MNLNVIAKVLLLLCVMTVSYSSGASVLFQSFSYDGYQFSFSLDEQNAEYDPAGFFVSETLTAPDELFTFNSSDPTLNFDSVDESDFDTFEVYFDEILTNGIFSFALEFTSDDIALLLDYDAEFDIFDFFIEDLSTGDVLIDVQALGSELLTEELLIINNDINDVDAPSSVLFVLLCLVFLSLRYRKV
jgi:hypothetical protein